MKEMSRNFMEKMSRYKRDLVTKWEKIMMMNKRLKVWSKRVKVWIKRGL